MNFERERVQSLKHCKQSIVSIWIATGNYCVEYRFSLLECIIKTHGMPNEIFARRANEIFARRANDIMFSEFRFARFVLKISFPNFV